MPSFIYIPQLEIEKVFQAPVSLGSGTTQTYSGVSLGAEASDREIFVVMTGLIFGSAPTISSVTVGGVSATLATASTTSISFYGLSALVAFATVPSGTTGDIVVTWSAAPTRGGIAVYRVTGRPTLGAIETSTASATLSSLGTSVSISSMSVAASGFTLCALLHYDPVSGMTISGLNLALDDTSQTYAKFASNPLQASASTASIAWAWSSTSAALTAAWSFN